MSDLPVRDAETYLGDGLYASFDGWQIVLRAPRMPGDHIVALDPAVYQSLRAWIMQHPGLKRHMEGA